MHSEFNLGVNGRKKCWMLICYYFIVILCIQIYIEVVKMGWVKIKKNVFAEFIGRYFA